MNTLKIFFWSTVILFFSFLMIRLTIPYFSFETDVDFLLTKQAILYNKIWLTSFYFHIGASPFILLAGILQFNNYFLKNHRKIHRALGNVYVLLILIVSAPSGFVMALYANGGILAKTSFLIISVLWWYFTWKSYREIKKRNVSAHRNFMMRSYALTLSAITLRLYTFTIPQIVHMPGVELYILVSWLSWIPNLLVAEWIIRNKNNSETNALT
jgi:uncharacterized membrane protein